MIHLIKDTLKKIRQSNPLVLNITNSVTMDFVANGLLALGASPVMSQSKEELEDLARLASSLVINIGTLNADFLALAAQACQFANQYNKPIILDPVGAGATSYRTQSTLHLLKNYQVQIIRANASEIAALSGASFSTKGVDSAMSSLEAIDTAQTLAASFNTVICMSGAIDVIANQTQTKQHHHGTAMMPTVTGTGCLLSAVAAAFHAVEPEAFCAAELAACYYGLCGEQATQLANGPGTFKSHFIDALYHLEV